MWPCGVSFTDSGRGTAIMVPYHARPGAPIGTAPVTSVIWRRVLSTSSPLRARNNSTPLSPPAPGRERPARKSMAAGTARKGDGSRVPDQTNSSCQLGGRPERLLPQLLTTGCNVGFQRGWAYRNPDPNGALNHL